MTAARPAHAWYPEANQMHLPESMSTSAHMRLQRVFLCSVFRSYAKLHIQPSEGLPPSRACQLHEWLLLRGSVKPSVSEPQQL